MRFLANVRSDFGTSFVITRQLRDSGAEASQTWGWCMSYRHLFVYAAFLGLCAHLAACGGGAPGVGGGGGENDPDLTQTNRFCHTIPAVSSNCSPCVGVSNPALAFDENLATHSGMGAGAQSNYQARSSEVQSAGSIAGVYFVLPDPAGVSITLSTYLSGVQQELSTPLTRQTPNDNCSGAMVECDFSDGAESFVGLGTTKPYDEIRAAVSNSSSDQLLIYEICVR